MTIWFTSDWHLEHKNIMKYSRRPFNSVNDMNWTIINNFNSKIDENDVVYFLGDFCFNKYKTEEFLNAITGKIHFIMGNHDRGVKHLFRRYGETVSDITVLRHNDVSITLCHYPMVTFSRSHFNSWQLYGHHHRDTSQQIKGKRMNVGVDVHNFEPISIKKVARYMEKHENNWDYIPRERRNRN